MSFIMVDVEADGPIPGKYSMVSFAAVVVEPSLSKIFYGCLKPISENWVKSSLQITGMTREYTLQQEEPKKVMEDFEAWIEENSKGKPFFISDNDGIDWMFISWYFHTFLNKNPFGHVSYNLASLYKGVVRDVFQNFKHLRKTAYTHNPVDDAKGNAEALLAIKEKYDLKIRLD